MQNRKFNTKVGEMESNKNGKQSQILLNPHNYTRKYPDEKSRDLMLNTIDFFEKKVSSNSRKTITIENGTMISSISFGRTKD